MALNTPLSQYRRKAYQDFSGGLNTTDSALRLPANQFTQLDNCFINDRGLLEKAKGYTKDSSPFPNAANSLVRMLVNYKQGTTVDKLVAAAQDDGNANATYKVDLKETSGDTNWSYIGYTTGTCTFTNGSANVTAGAGTAFTLNLKAGDKIKPNATSAWYEISAVTGAGTLTLTTTFAEATQANAAYKARIILHKDFLPRGINFNDNLIVTNGSETPMSYNNTTLTLLQSANAPKGKYICAHKRRVFIAGTSAAPSSIYWSAANDETTWDATSVEPVFPKDGGYIVNIVSFADSLIVFKNNGAAYQINGNFDQTAAGAVAWTRRVDVPYNILQIIGLATTVGQDNKLYFLAETGVYSIDPSMRVKYETWDFHGLFDGMSLKSTLTSSKQYLYDTKTQWDLGTHAGTRASSGGDLQQYFNQFTISDAYQGINACSCAIDANNNLNVAYLSTDQKKVLFKQYASADDSVTSETALDISVDAAFSGATSSTFLSLSLAVNAAGTEVGIAVKANKLGGAVYYFIKRVSSAWSAAEVIYTVGGPYRVDQGISLAYGSDAKPRVAFCQGNGSNGEEITYGTRASGSWVVNENFNAEAYNDCSMVVSGTANIYICGSRESTGDVYYWTSTNDGTSFAAGIIGLTVSGATDIGDAGKVNIQLNAASDIILTATFRTGATDKGKLFRKNVTTGVTTTVDSGTDNVFKGYVFSNPGNFYYESKTGSEKFIYDYSYNAGTATLTNGSTAVTGTNTKWSTFVAAGDLIKIASQAESVYGTVSVVNSDTSITLTANYTGATATAAYNTKRTLSITSPVASTLNDTYRPGDHALHNNGNVFGSVSFGANANEIIACRIAFVAQYTTNENNDSTLTAWSTYDVGSQSSNGCTVVHEVALNTASPATIFSPISTGSVVSTDATQIYIKAKVTSIISSYAGMSIGSITISYTGSGIDGKLPTAVTFNNELYFSYAENGQAANNKCLHMDRGNAWLNLSYPVSVFAVYKKKLYAGSASNGDVYILRNQYRANTSAYTMTAITKEDLLGSLELSKEVYKVYVIYELKSSGSFVFSYRTDSYKTVGGSTWKDTTVQMSAAQDGTGFAEIDVKASNLSSIQFKVSNANTDDQVAIIGFVVLYGYLGLR